MPDLTGTCAPPQALVDRPDEVRRVINFKRLAITDLKVDIPRLAKKKVLKEALATSGARRGLAADAPVPYHLHPAAAADWARSAAGAEGCWRTAGRRGDGHGQCKEPHAGRHNAAGGAAS